MKTAVIGLALLLLVGIGGFAAYTFILVPASGQAETQTTGEPVLKTGTLQIAAGDDYTHVLLTSEGTVKVNSPVVDLSPFVGKKVRLKGEFSGTTLFVDTALEQP